MRPRTAVPIAAVLALAAAATLSAAEPIPITIQAVSSPEAPFKLTVGSARLLPEAGGRYSIGFQVAVQNVTSNSLVTAGGWSLDISKPDGTLMRRVKVAQGFDIDPGKTQTARVILDSKAIGPVDPSHRFKLTPATGATVSYGQRCQGPSQSCEGIEHYCELWCNNPLVPQGGVAGYSCSCHWWWDSQGQCWRYVCPFTCECVGLPEPPYQDPFIPWM